MREGATSCCDPSGIEEFFVRSPGYRSPSSLNPGLMAAIPSGSVVGAKPSLFGGSAPAKRAFSVRQSRQSGDGEAGDFAGGEVEGPPFAAVAGEELGAVAVGGAETAQ